MPIMRKIFDGLALGDLVEPFQDAPCGVAGNAPVRAAQVAGEFGPFTAVGDAVSEKTDFVRRVGESAEQVDPVLPVAGEVVDIVGTARLCGNEWCVDDQSRKTSNEGDSFKHGEAP